MKARLLFFSLLGVSLLLAGCMQMMVRSENHSLDIYGKVVDQNGELVIGAKVEGGITSAKDFLHTSSEVHYTITDSNGCFKFLGLRGIGIGIRPQKEGYEFSFSSTHSLQLPSERHGDNRPDRNNPVVFTVWKLKGPEPMRHTEFRTRIPYDGTTAVFDLTNGKKNPNGILQITLLRNPLNVRRGKDHFDWTFKIEIPAGGLLTENDSYPNWAPDNGYQAIFLKTVNATDSPWQARFIQNFYFKDAAGNYGRLFVDVTTDSDTADTGMRIESWVNPSGSQNLEFDPAKRIH
jgi:hypothetical protein